MKLIFMMTAAVCVSLAATGAFAQQKQVVRMLKNCGSEATKTYGSHTEYPGINEGNGFVGFKTYDVDTAGTTLRFSLLNCDTLTFVRADGEYKLKDSGKGLASGGDLFDFVDQLRKQNRLANETLFARKAKERGYTVTTGKLPEMYSENARRSDCGCLAFDYYPGK
jgi:hypothetical protein